MRRDRILLGALLCAFVVALSRGAGPPPAVAVPDEIPGVAPTARAPEAVPVLRRNPFEFGAEPIAASPQRVANVGPALSAPTPGPPSPGPSARLVGFVVQGGRTRAIVALEGEAHLLRVGEEAGGYTLLAMDEAEGIRLRTPGGDELALAVPE